MSIAKQDGRLERGWCEYCGARWQGKRNKNFLVVSLFKKKQGKEQEERSAGSIFRLSSGLKQINLPAKSPF